MKKFFIAIAIIFFQMSVSSAKIISDSTGRITFETSNNWYPISVGGDAFTIELQSIALDKDTFVSFKQSKDYMNYKSLYVLSDTQKSIIRDNIIQFHLNGFKNQNYYAIVNKAGIYDNAIIVGFTLRKNGIEYKMVTYYSIKNYVAYTVSLGATNYTAYEAMNVAKSLKIDGILFTKWVVQ